MAKAVLEVADTHRRETAEGIAEERLLPHPQFALAWTAIKVEDDIRGRLVAQALLALQLRQHFAFETVPVHGLIVLAGPPGTGKTTLARGLANEVARAIPGGVRFVQVDPHALASSALGRSQREVTRLLRDVIPEYAAQGSCIVLLDEVETLAASRYRVSLEANPVDVHRATDALLAGIDILCREHRNTLLIATTNFQDAVDPAFLSRADWIEVISLPGEDARAQIIAEVLDHLATRWPRVSEVKREMETFVRTSEGLDGRRLRKAIISAAATSVEIARDPNGMKAKHVVAALKAAAKVAR